MGNEISHRQFLLKVTNPSTIDEIYHAFKFPRELLLIIDSYIYGQERLDQIVDLLGKLPKKLSVDPLLAGRYNEFEWSSKPFKLAPPKERHHNKQGKISSISEVIEKWSSIFLPRGEFNLDDTYHRLVLKERLARLEKLLQRYIDNHGLPIFAHSYVFHPSVLRTCHYTGVETISIGTVLFLQIRYYIT